MRRALTFVVHVVWAVSMVTLGTWIGAAHGWVYHGWLGAIALGGVGLVSERCLQLHPQQFFSRCQGGFRRLGLSLTQRRHRSLRLCLRTGFSPINAIVLTGKTWYPALGAGTCGGTRVMQALHGKPLPARRVGVPRTWKGFGHEKSSVSASDRCHHRYHCLGDTITSSGVAGRLGWLACRSRRRSNCWYGDRWNSGRRPRPWPRLLLLPRTG
jgi:hypothetical protein